MPGVSGQGVFLSYRREDAGPYARLLQRELIERFPDARVFMDLDSIEGGVDFAEVIEEAVASCAVLVALIGRQWATLTDEEGARRLDNPDDFVRFEVKTAVERGVRVVPVLIDGAQPLRRQGLPAELHKLARLNALELSYRRFQDDAEHLFGLIQQVLAAAAERAQTERQAKEETARQAREQEQAAQLKAQGAALIERLAVGQRQAREEAVRQAQEAAARRAQQEEAERLAQENEAERLAQEEVARREDERKAREKADRKAQEEADRKARAEAELLTLTERARAAENAWPVAFPPAKQQQSAARARDCHAGMLPIRERVLGAEHPDTLTTRANLATWTGRAGDAAGARDQFAALLLTRERVLGAEHPDTLTTRHDLANWTGEAGDAAGARDQFAELLPIQVRVSGPEHPDTLTTRRNLASWTGQTEDGPSLKED